MANDKSYKSHTKPRVSMQRSIADQVGVSRTTVSFVLNGKEKEGRISSVVAARIKEVARRENYRFNELARSLRTGHTRTIALVVADISDRFFATLAFHVQQHALHKGYLVVIASVGRKGVKRVHDQILDGRFENGVRRTGSEFTPFICGQHIFLPI